MHRLLFLLWSLLPSFINSNSYSSDTTTDVLVPLGQRTTVVSTLSATHPLLQRLQQRTNWTISSSSSSSNNTHSFLQINQHTVPIDTISSLQHFHRILRISHHRQTAQWNTTRLVTPPPTPRWPVRGNQISVAHHPSFFRTWQELRTFIVDLSIFGNNFIETAHINDTTTSLLRSPIINISTLLHELNTSCSLWWSNTLVDHHLSELSALFQHAPRVDSVFFPGGDGGALEWSTIQRTAEALRKHHPQAGLWVSAQEVNATTFQQFVHHITTNKTIQHILSSNGGVVYGPHNRMPLTEFVQLFSVKVRQYPDLAHSVDAQFALQHWDAPYAESYQRQVVNPLPLLHTSIVQARSNGSSPNSGVGAYSEGLNDDLNKFIWSAMGANDQTGDNASALVEEYCQYFFGDDAAASMTRGVMGLEQNWVGKVLHNGPRIQTTLSNLQKGYAAMSTQQQQDNWRGTMYLRRGVMDHYIYLLHKQDMDMYTAARAALSSKDEHDKDCHTQLHIALHMLAPSSSIHNASSDPVVVALRQRIVDLASDLERQVGAEVLQTQDTALNMNSIDSQLYVSSRYLHSFLFNLSNVHNASTVCHHIGTYLNWTDPGSGGYYDNIGSIDSQDRPHVVTPSDNKHNSADPSCYNEHCVLQGGSNAIAQVRPSWLRYGMVMFDNTMTLRYENIDAAAQYVWEVVMWYCWFDCTNDVVDFTANGMSLTKNLYIQAPNPMRVLSFEVPPEALNSGVVEISCERMAGLGGNGKTCQLTEAWLRKV